MLSDLNLFVNLIVKTVVPEFNYSGTICLQL
nr:MAG TPA: hypothetical protein [Caudoviricetes sp.]DAN60818.1 MAG TPA: hypothetical protein [Caudoviricetes sp.]